MCSTHAKHWIRGEAWETRPVGVGNTTGERGRAHMYNTSVQTTTYRLAVRNGDSTHHHLSRLLLVPRLEIVCVCCGGGSRLGGASCRKLRVVAPTWGPLRIGWTRRGIGGAMCGFFDKVDGVVLFDTCWKPIRWKEYKSSPPLAGTRCICPFYTHSARNHGSINRP